MIKVIDNVVSSIYQDRLEETFLSMEGASWRFNSHLTHESSKSGEFGFTHILVNPNYRSEYFNYVLPLVYEISEKSGVNVSDILLARSFLQTPSISPYDNDLFHIDMPQQHHMVFLYYVNDSDGDTLISSKRYNQQPYSREREMPVRERITPKKGRVVVFDGDLFHAAGIPKKNVRCILNFDVSVDKK